MTEHEQAKALAKAEELIAASDRGLLHSGMKDIVLLARAYVRLAREYEILNDRYWDAMDGKHAK